MVHVPVYADNVYIYKIMLCERISIILSLSLSLSLPQSESSVGGVPLTKRGYLFKGPFPQDGGISVSMKNYRKRWFTLTGGPSEGGYTLTLYKVRVGRK